MQIYIVTAEANGVPQTTDGVWFHILGVFTDKALAEEFHEKCRTSGEWEQLDEDGYLHDHSQWQVELHERTAHEGEVPEVPEGYSKAKL